MRKKKKMVRRKFNLCAGAPLSSSREQQAGCLGGGTRSTFTDLPLSLCGCRDYFRTVVTPAASLLLKGGNSLLLCINHSDALRHRRAGRGTST